MRIGFIGAGQMAQALAQGFVRQGRVAAQDLSAADCFAGAREAFAQVLPEAQVVTDNRQVVEASDLIVLAVKPQHIAAVAGELSPLDASKLAVSIAAGVSLTRLAGLLGSNRIIRVMPNTPCLVGHGAAGFCRGTAATAEDAELVAHLLSAVGNSFELPESLLDAVTGLSGSGPAFVYTFIEALSDGGVRMGLPRNVALQLAAQTVLGAAAMVLQTGDHPGVLRDRVTSPGGTTIAGLEALEDRAFRAAAIAAVRAATARSTELGRDSG
ncbi:MAG: pyrroline-5-carboxylate reductase [Planctomycetales bacterium]|nr:pyrroline-5-carboxylate reductase [Planctomycetales bacterium]